MRIRRLAFLCVIGLARLLAWAEGTHTWQQSTYEEFEKGTAAGIAIDSSGTLQLAPSVRPVVSTPSTYVWSIAAGPEGGVFLGTGAPARVYAVRSNGKTSAIFQAKELQVQALVADAKGAVYAATSPDGRVYRLCRCAAPKKAIPEADLGNAAPDSDPAWSAEVLFAPGSKYIWALALDAQGNLYIATGDRGEIFRVDAQGRGSLFFKSDEAHIRALAIDAQGNLIAGSDGGGLIYRISPQGQAFVLYSAAKREITSLIIDRAGNIYAAAVGDKRSPGGSGAALLGGVSMPSPSSGGSSSSPASPAPLLQAVPPLTVSSEVYRIAPDGSPTRIWESQEDLVYALALDAQQRLTAATGNRGRILRLQRERQFTDLLKVSASQVTGFAPAPDGGLYAATSNLGKLFLLSATPETSGYYQSDVFDAGAFSRWGRVEVRGRGHFELWTRSGNVDNPDRNWSNWAPVDLHGDTPIASPAARFVQWKAVLNSTSPESAIDSVKLYYLPRNIAPAVDEVAVYVGARFPAAARYSGAESVVSSSSSGGSRGDSVPSTTRDRDAIAVRWAAHDDNDDQLIYSIYYRGEGETTWRLLKDKLTEKYYSFDAAMLPDGGYTLKVVASDAPSNPPGSALSDERESRYFEVDTTPPRIEGLSVARAKDGMHLTFRAIDNSSPIKRAEYSLDAGAWQFVEPVGHISDSRTESYDFNLPSVPDSGQVPGAEHLIAVRVWDRFDNLATAKTVLRTK